MHRTTKLLLAILVIVAVVSAMVACVPTTYTVTFHLYGTETTTVEVAQGATVQKPSPDPTRDNYVFAGWYADENLTEAFDFNVAIEKNTDVYAKWTPQGGEPEPSNPRMTFNDAGWVEYRATAIALTIDDEVSSEMREALTAEGEEVSVETEYFGELKFKSQADSYVKVSEKIAEDYFVLRFYSDGRVSAYKNGIAGGCSGSSLVVTFMVNDNNEYWFTASLFGMGELTYAAVVDGDGLKISANNVYTYRDLTGSNPASGENYFINGISQNITLEKIDNTGSYGLLGKVFTVGEQAGELEFASNDCAFMAVADTVHVYTWHQYGNKGFFNSKVEDEERTLMIIDVMNSELIVATYAGTETQVRLTYSADATVYESVIGKAFTAMEGMIKIQFLTESKVLGEMEGQQAFGDYYEAGKYVVVTIGEFEIFSSRVYDEEELTLKATADEFGDEPVIFSLDDETEINLNAPSVSGKEYALSYNGKYVVTNQEAFDAYVAESGKSAAEAVAARVNDIDGLDLINSTLIFSFYTDGKTVLRVDYTDYVGYMDIEEYEQYGDKVSIGMFGIGAVGADGKITAAIPDMLIGETVRDGFIAYFELTVVDGATVGEIGETAEDVAGTVWEVEDAKASLPDETVIPSGGDEEQTVGDYKAFWTENLKVTFYRDGYVVAVAESENHTSTIVSRYTLIGKFVVNADHGYIMYVIEDGKLTSVEGHYFPTEGDAFEFDMIINFKKATVDDPDSLNETPDEYVNGDPGHGPDDPVPGPGQPQPEDFVGYRFTFGGIVEAEVDGQPLADLSILDGFMEQLEQGYIEFVEDSRDYYAYYYHYNFDDNRFVEELNMFGMPQYDENDTDIITLVYTQIMIEDGNDRNWVSVQVKYVKSDIRAQFEFGETPENASGIYVADSGETMTVYSNPLVEGMYIMNFDDTLWNVSFRGPYMIQSGKIAHKLVDGELRPYAPSHVDDFYFLEVWNKTYVKTEDAPLNILTLIDGKSFELEAENFIDWGVSVPFGEDDFKWYNLGNQDEYPAPQEVIDFVASFSGLRISFNGDGMTFGQETYIIADLIANNRDLTVVYVIEGDNYYMQYEGCNIFEICISVIGEEKLTIRGNKCDGTIEDFHFYIAPTQA